MQPRTGWDGNHVALQCAKLRKLSLSERRKALERSGLCMYCLKHATERECYGQGGPTKPQCPRPKCGGGHTTGAHKLLGEVDASINLVAEEGVTQMKMRSGGSIQSGWMRKEEIQRNPKIWS